jgi:oxepin-CoA hydrolase/3-oxo-5,6-dehydrosuberyl-CoA semialdehyde dehydrogenase
MPHDGTPGDAAAIVALGGGMLVTSVYSNDEGWLRGFLEAGGCHGGRLYVGSDASAAEAPGSGVAMPQSLHGGPGRAGGGEELGGTIGLQLYLQRVALQGDRGVLEGMVG